MSTTGIVWKKEEEQLDEFNHIKNTRNEKFGQDGFIEVGTGNYKYKGIWYVIKVLRYYNYRECFRPISNRISDTHVVVEYPERKYSTMLLFLRLFNKEKFYKNEFLWYDTLHYWNDKQELEEQIAECHERAKKDIDGLNFMERFLLKFCNTVM